MGARQGGKEIFVGKCGIRNAAEAGKPQQKHAPASSATSRESLHFLIWRKIPSPVNGNGMILWNTVKTIFFLCLYFHAVAYPRNGNNDIGEIQFFADIAYMHVYGAALAFEIHAPEDVQDLLPCHDAVPVFPKG